MNYIFIYRIVCRALRVLTVSAILLVVLSFVNGCSSHRTVTKPRDFDYENRGIASYYADRFQSGKTASGEIFDNNLMTAAHRTLPFGTYVIVKNLNNGKSVKVRINDRGPFVRRVIIDLSRVAFSKIEEIEKGLTQVEIHVVD